MPKRQALRIAAVNRNMVDEGCTLTADIKAKTASLEEIKDTLRREAGLRLMLGVSEVQVEGNLGVASIYYPKPTFKINTKKVEELRTLLGSKFTEYVEETVEWTTSKDYDALLSKATSELRQSLKGIIVSKPSTPRVCK